MSIKINGESFDIAVYDDENTVLQRYSIKKGGTIPEYLSIEGKDVEIRQGENITVRDIRDELRNISLENLSSDEKIIEKIIKRFPSLSRKDIVIIYLLELYKDVINTNKLLKLRITADKEKIKMIDSETFFNERKIESLLKDYQDELKKAIRELQKKVDTQEKALNFLRDSEPLKTEDFQLEEITNIFAMELSTGISLDDIFDSMKVSRDIPFIHLSIGKKNWYKVYQHLPPPENWLKNKDINGIYFKILNTGYANLNSKGGYDQFYSDGMWYENNNVSITYKIRKDLDEELIKTKFFNSFDDRLNYELFEERQMGVKGKFTVNNINFNKAVFADMVDNFPIFSHFLFFDERLQDAYGKYKSAIVKERFTFYYEPGQTYEKSKSLTITVTPYLSEEEPYDVWVDVRISRAHNKQQIQNFQSVFSRMLRIYLENYENVIKKYRELLPSSEALFEKYTKKPKYKPLKKDKKSKKRVINLKKQRPYVFRSGYASICQPADHQPYLLNEKEAKKFLETHDPHKIMEFTDPSTGKKDWYACEPREEGEVQTHVYPGLQPNTRSKAQYKKDVPFFPCCFSEDQYTKPAAELRKRLEKGYTDQEEMHEDTLDVPRHFFAPNKTVIPGRFGQIPFYLSFVVKSAGYKIAKFGKVNSYPIFRYGVTESPDSFLHCLEKAFNPRYSYVDNNGRKQIVSNARKDLAEMDFSVARQELFDFSDELIKDTLLDDLHYLDPGLWIRLAEVKYDCNIFIYQISEDYPNGAIVLPRFSQAYLFSDIPDNKRTVFIVKKAITGNFPFQCEILTKYDKTKKGGKFSYFLENDPFIAEATKILYDSNNVSVVTPTSSFFYAPVQLSGKLFHGVESQYIDQNGKTRMLNYSNGVSLMVSPLPPLNVPINMKIGSTTTENALKFIKEKGLIIRTQDGSEYDDLIQGFWVESEVSKNTGIYYGYIPLEETKGLPNVDYELVYSNDPLRTDRDSDLETMHRIRKIADFLKQYTLFQYSLNPESFDANSFMVIPDHNYDIKSLNKKLIPNNPVMYKDGKLIVPSEDITIKLINFLKVNLLNDYPGVINYSKREVVKDYYRTLNDFLKFPQQLIFLTRQSIIRWKVESLYKIYRNNILSNVVPTQEEPYFYRNYNIKKGKLILVQNVRHGKLENALAVARKWEKDNVNPGYDYEGLHNVNYRLYTEEGEANYIKQKGGKDEVNVIEYKNGEYAALLLFQSYSK